MQENLVKRRYGVSKLPFGWSRAMHSKILARARRDVLREIYFGGCPSRIPSWSSGVLGSYRSGFRARRLSSDIHGGLETADQMVGRRPAVSAILFRFSSRVSQCSH